MALITVNYLFKIAEIKYELVYSEIYYVHVYCQVWLMQGGGVVLYCDNITFQFDGVSDVTFILTGTTQN